jgi:hypothetical protein
VSAPFADTLRGRVLALAASAALAGCAGGPGTPDGPAVNSPGGGGQPPTPLVGVMLTVTLPPPAHGLRPGYVSPNTQSLTIDLASVDGSAVSGVGASVVNTFSDAHGCKLRNGARVCTAKIDGSPGDDVFAVTTYAGRDATGAVLSVGTVGAHVSAGGGGVGVNSLSLSIDGVIAALRLGVSPKEVPRGKPARAAVALRAYDASGAQIVGGSPFQAPIELTIQGDVNHAFTLHAQHASGESLAILRPPGEIALAYDGDGDASPVTLQAIVQGPSDPSATTHFSLHGKPPPPPVGTIYALNLGAAGGRAATVTVYDGSAQCDAAPIRVLQLDPKLYARSIAVDSNGLLYVGYLDSQLGFSPGTGLPDKHNLIAVYAAGANGSDKPIATLVADPKTQTLLFPIYTAFDPSGNLVTYGATAVDSNGGGDAVLTYAAGSSGPAAPLHGWNFNSPRVNYAGPAGLAIDAQGNFYVSGALKSSLGPSYGVFVAAAADDGNPNANPARTIPWDQTTQVVPGLGNNVTLDPSGEIFVSNVQLQGSGSTTACQGRANVFAAGASGGITDDPPLRVLVLKGVFTADPTCASPHNPLQPFFPAMTLYGSTLFVADAFNDAVDAFPSARGGTIAPSVHIAGAATQLDAPIALVISSLSGHASAGPVTGVTPRRIDLARNPLTRPELQAAR